MASTAFLEAAAVGTGAVAGALLRYGTAKFCAKYFPDDEDGGDSQRRGIQPIGTCVVNITGSFLLGAITASAHLNPTLKLMLGTGFCGSYTTYSTFTVDTMQMLNDGRHHHAGTYVLITKVGGVLAAFLGMYLFRGKPPPLPAPATTAAAAAATTSTTAAAATHGGVGGGVGAAAGGSAAGGGRGATASSRSGAGGSGVPGNGASQARPQSSASPLPLAAPPTASPAPTPVATVARSPPPSQTAPPAPSSSTPVSTPPAPPLARPHDPVTTHAHHPPSEFTCTSAPVQHSVASIGAKHTYATVDARLTGPYPPHPTARPAECVATHTPPPHRSS